MSIYMTFAGIIMLVMLMASGRFLFHSPREKWIGLYCMAHNNQTGPYCARSGPGKRAFFVGSCVWGGLVGFLGWYESRIPLLPLQGLSPMTK